MAFRGFLKQSTQVTKTVLMVDSSDHITGKTGLAAGITKYLTKVGGTPTAATMTTSELDATNTKGIYSLVFTTSHTDTLGEFALHLSGTGADPTDDWWEVVSYLPGEAATLQADQAVNATKVGGTTQTGRDIGASVLLSSGTGTGQLDFTSGIVKSNLSQILGTALTETAGQIAAAFKKFFNIGTPAATMDHGILVDTVTTYTGNTPQTGDAFARLGVAGVGLTNLGDTRIAHLDADISTRTKPADTQAAVTLVTTTTNLTTNNDKTGYALSNTGMDNLLDRTNGVETGFTLRQAMRLMLAALAGKLSGGNTTTVTIRDVNDTADRITATVDANGNRTAVTLID